MKPSIGLLTGADDLSYALGLTTALAQRDIAVDFIGSDQIDAPALHQSPLIHFMNLRGDQSTDAPRGQKVARILRYYVRLLHYAVVARPRLFHLLWNNKFEHLDRTALMLWYRLWGRRVVMTVHNVNAAKRDGRDNALNRATLAAQYRLCSHLFVHTERMLEQLRREFKVPDDKISVIPFGINNTNARTGITPAQARERLGLAGHLQVMLFFGQIAPYKGLEHLVAALPELMRTDPTLHLVIAGKVKQGCEAYWSDIQKRLADPALASRVTCRIEHIPDADVEVYFNAADVLVLPYVHIFQSGVPFLAYSFGLPVVATDVGALRDDIVDGRTGWVCRPGDPADLAAAVRRHFDSDLHRSMPAGRQAIQDFANDRYSWHRVAAITEAAYRKVLPAR